MHFKHSQIKQLNNKHEHETERKRTTSKMYIINKSASLDTEWTQDNVRSRLIRGQQGTHPHRYHREEPFRENKLTKLSRQVQKWTQTGHVAMLKWFSFSFHLGRFGILEIYLIDRV